MPKIAYTNVSIFRNDIANFIKENDVVVVNNRTESKEPFTVFCKKITVEEVLKICKVMDKDEKEYQQEKKKSLKNNELRKYL